MIYKYSLEVNGFQREVNISIPKNPSFLSVGVDRNNIPCIWCEVNLDSPTTVPYKFKIKTTGESFDDYGLQYLGSYGINDNQFIGHVYLVMDVPQSHKLKSMENDNPLDRNGLGIDDTLDDDIVQAMVEAAEEYRQEMKNQQRSIEIPVRLLKEWIDELNGVEYIANIETHTRERMEQFLEDNTDGS